MAGTSVETLVSDFFSYAPKLAAFEAGQAITLPVAPASYELDLPAVGKVKVSESGTTVTVQKG